MATTPDLDGSNGSDSERPDTEGDTSGPLDGPARQTRTRKHSTRSSSGLHLGTVPEIAAAVIASAMLLVAFGRVVRDGNRGVDLTDEGMYLWSADPPTPTDLFHAPFGRYTGMLYRIAGWDIARFRALGVVLLVAAALLLGRSCVLAAGRWRRTTPSVAAQIIGAVIVAAGATTGYTLYLLTPNYNWINLLGLLLAAAGGVEMAVPSPSRRRFGSWVWPTCTAVGAFVSMTGKPSSGPVILGLTAVLVVTVGPGPYRRNALPILRLAAATAVVWILHFLFVNGPADTAEMYRRGLDALRILDPASYEIANAVKSVWSAVTDLPERVADGTAGLVLVAAASLALTARRVRADVDTVAAVSVVVLVGSCTALALDGLWIGSSAGYVVLATVGSSIILCTLPLAVTARLLEGRQRMDERSALAELVGDFVDGTVDSGAIRRPGTDETPPGWWAPFATATYLVLFAAAYAFGSGNGFWSQLNGGLALMFAGAVVLLVVYVDLPSGRPVAGILAVVVAIGGANVLETARDSPYRTAGMDEQTIARSFGPHGSRMLLDPETAAYLDRLRGMTYGNGFSPGTPMLDFTYYSATALYDLDALVPHSLIPTVGAYAATNALARWSIEQLEPEIWRDAWVLWAPENPAAPDPKVVEILGRTFPDDYVLIGELTWWQRGELQQVWRPVDA